jgi:hypothetical protein
MCPMTAPVDSCDGPVDGLFTVMTTLTLVGLKQIVVYSPSRFSVLAACGGGTGDLATILLDASFLNNLKSTYIVLFGPTSWKQPSSLCSVSTKCLASGFNYSVTCF